MPNRKILIILTQAFDPDAGGVQRSTYKMSHYFASKNQMPFIFSYENEGHINIDFATIYHAPEPNGCSNPKNGAYLEQVIDSIAPDVVISQCVYMREVGISLSKCKQRNGFLLLGCLRNTLFPVVNNLDGYRKRVLPKVVQPLFANSLGRNLLLKAHKRKHAGDLRFVLDVYDWFILFGEPNRKELEYFVGAYKNDKLAYVPNSIPTVASEIPHKEKVILYLSRLDYVQKRADLILPLWKMLMDRLPDWRMEIVGDGLALDAIKQQINKENIPRVKVFGKQKPDSYYSRAPIYIMTSAFEGFPNTLIEAQSYGCVPVVYDNYFMAGWVIQENKDGFLILPFEVEKMAERILLLVQNETKRQEMAAASLENARRFTIEKVGKQWLDFFDEKLENSSANHFF